MSIELKIKAKHLALEPGIIRCEEYRLKERIKYLKTKGKETTPLVDQLRSLNTHRRWDVRNEARATHLARTFLAKKPYICAEQKRKAEREGMFQRQIIPRIVAMVKKYGNDERIDEKAIQNWTKL